MGAAGKEVTRLQDSPRLGFLEQRSRIGRGEQPDAAVSNKWVSLLRIVFMAAMLSLWEGFPLPLLGMNNILAYQAYAAIAFLGTAFYAYRAFTQKFRIGFWQIMPALLFLSCCVTSAVFNIFVIPQTLMGWAPAVYTVAPILTIFLYAGIGGTLKEGENALYWTGLLGSGLIVVHNLMHAHFLDFYGRGSAFSESRIVFFKLEASFALMIALIRFTNARSLPAAVAQIGVMALTGYNVFVLTESRLAIVAFLGATILVWMFVFSFERKLIGLMLAPVIGVPLVWYVVNTYLAGFQGYDQYLGNDKSAHWRFITIDHFQSVFMDSHGLGFGFMSGNSKFDNVISFATNVIGERYGLKNYGTYLDDIGLYAALFQFGVIGFALVLVMTGAAIVSFVRTAKLGREYGSTAAIGFMMLSFLPSPIPMNYFTLFYSAHIGGLLWFMAWRASVARQEAGPLAARGMFDGLALRRGRGGTRANAGGGIPSAGRGR